MNHTARAIALLILTVGAASGTVASAARRARIDREPPVIFVPPAPEVKGDQPLLLRAQVKDGSGVAAVTVWARGEADSAFNPFAMHDEGDGNFAATLPDWPTRGGHVAYYVEAHDAAGNGPRLGGQPSSPYMARVEDTPAATAVATPSAGAWPGILAGIAVPAGVFGVALAHLRRTGRPAPLQRREESRKRAAVDRRSKPSHGKKQQHKRRRGPAGGSSPRSASGSPHRHPQRSGRGKGGRHRARGRGRGRSSGMTLVEMLVLLTLLGLALSFGALYLKPMAAPLVTGGRAVEGLFRQTRAIAMASTTAHRIRPASDHELLVEYGPSCAGTVWSRVGHMDMQLPQDVTLGSSEWAICFSSRGLASENVVLTLNHPLNGSRSLEVLLGGMVRWLP